MNDDEQVDGHIQSAPRFSAAVTRIGRWTYRVQLLQLDEPGWREIDRWLILGQRRAVRAASRAIGRERRRIAWEKAVIRVDGQ